MLSKQLWLVRPFPYGENRMDHFLTQKVIQVGWNQIGDLSICQTRDDIRQIVAPKNLKKKDEDLKVGLNYNFALQMNIGDYCLIPFEDVFYVAVITGDYRYNGDEKVNERTVTFLNNSQPFGDKDRLPDILKKSLRSRLALANLSNSFDVFIEYLNKKPQYNEIPEAEFIQKLLPQSLSIIERELQSDNKHQQLLAAVAVVIYSKSL